MYKVFYNERTVFFTENKELIQVNEKSIVYNYKNADELKLKITDFLNSEEFKTLYVLCSNEESTFKEYSGFYTVIEAAGGAVINKNNEILFIFRRNKWDLPKGKIEKNESSEIAAIREVEEECGITNLKIVRPLEITYHTYPLNNKIILKPTYWYEMQYLGAESPKPQFEEDITEACWLPQNEFSKVYKNTFPSIINVLKKIEI
ncbi:MAG: NUDIX domain-containing protein [Bacteroidales bacterium]|nr:NUDIX domain-containing protein [Bacteroidales bacterium]